MPPSSTGGSRANSVKDSPNAPAIAKSDADVSAEDLQQAPETVNLSEADELAASESKDDSDGGKIKALLGILRRMMGVKDLAAIRLSLPANLLEPVPNLEYWNYLDRGDIFSVIGDYEDPLDRMLAALRFAFTKELKFVHGKICKPYNSILGEHFRCHWNVMTPELLESGHMMPRHALRTEQARALPNAKGKVAGFAQPAPTPVKASEAPAKGKEAPAKQAEPSSDSNNGLQAPESISSQTSRDSRESSEASKPAGSGDQGTTTQAPNRPKGSRGLSAMSNLTIGSNKSAKDGDKTHERKREKFSRFLSTGRTNKSSGNSIKSVESSSSPTTTATAESSTPTQDSVSQGVDAKPSEGGTDWVKEGEDNGSDSSSFKTPRSSTDAERASAAEALVSASGGLKSEQRRVAFLTEQVSHHPPISSFYVDCKDSGVELYGVDQLSAKFTGTNVKIYSGSYNQGIFVRLAEKAKCGAVGEEYQITHPTASVNGLLRGSLWVSISGNTSVTCRGGKRGNDDGKRLRSLIEYKEEPWVGKAKYALEGVIYEYDANKEGADTEFNSVKEVPSDRVIGTFEGTWKGQINFKLKGEKESQLLIDLNELDPIGPKDVRAVEEQDEMESRKIWKPVTDAILGKQFNEATKNKQVIEQAQRDRAAERKKKGEEFAPRFFESNIDDGRPKLTDAGRQAVDAELSR